jgi:tetratricopeptide (TPR) repeat protein
VPRWFLRWLFLCGLALSDLAPSTLISPPSLFAQGTLLGHISFPNSGAPAAQAPFIRGVLLLHNFEYDDAIAAFREAERLDPNFALAFWGEALSYDQPLWYNESVDKARTALARLAPTPAARQAKAPTAREKGYLEAVERLYGTGDEAGRNRAYSERMAELSRAFPQDDEAALFYALSLLASIPNGQRNPEISLKAGAIASAVLKRNPDHPGAAHYALHAYDDGEHAAMGLQAARIYARIAPASSHARHMPSHAFLPLGLWDEAAASDEAAYQTSVDLARAKGLSAAQYDFHALSWLHYEYLQQGRFDKAQGLLGNVDRALGELTASRANQAAPLHAHVESEIGRGNGPLSLENERASMRARFVVESGRWESMKGQGSFGNVDELFALGLASVKLGDRARAEAALEQLQGARAAAPDDTNRRLAEIMYREVGGLYQILRGEKTQGLAALAAAARLEAEMPKPIARPYPIKPAGELYAEALLASGDPVSAVRQFTSALARTPRRAASLIGLARAAKAAGDSAQASQAAREFVAMWHLADSGRPEIAEAQRLSH